METVNSIASQSSQNSDITTDKLLHALSSKNAQIRRNAARVLTKISTPQAVNGLLQALTHKNEEVCGWAAWTLAQTRSPAIVAMLVKALNHSVPHVRIWAIWALGQIYTQDAVKGLLQALSHPDSQVRWRAVSSLGQIISKISLNKNKAEKVTAFKSELVNRLKQQLLDPHHYVRGRIAVVFGKIGTEAAVPSLIQLLNDSEFYVRWRAAEALGVIGSNSAVTGLLQTINHQDPDIRLAVVSALGQSRNKEAVAALIQALEDTDLFIRGKAASALGEIGTDLVIPALQTALKDRENYVSCRAEEALIKISNHRVNDDLSFSSQALIKTQTEQLESISVISEPAHKFLQIIVTSYAEASEHLLCKVRAPLIQHIISIGSPSTTPVQGFSQIPNRLRLEFDDIEAPNNDPEYILATPEHIHKVLNFVALGSEREGNLLIHCQAGISRSAAVALIIFAQLLGVGKEEEAVAYLLATRPQANPNRWIVELADTALGRKGKLIKAVQSNNSLG